MALPHQHRIDAGVDFDWDSLPPCQANLDEVPSDSEELRFDCERFPHRRIRRFKQLRRVWLYGVDQNDLEDIVQLPNIQSLYIEGLTAIDLSLLSRLPHLRRVILKKCTKIWNLDWVAGLPRLESLAVEGFEKMLHLDPLACLARLSALGIQGSTDAPTHVASLAPLSGLGDLRYLFICCLRTSDGSLKPLYSLKRLEILECGAAYFHDDEFVSLHRALPRLRCEWFDLIERYGSTGAAFKAFMDAIGLHDQGV